MRTRTRAIMFTDIKGYTALTAQRTPEQTAALMRTHRRLIAPILQAFDGILIKTIGDAFMVAFASPTKAVQCAMAIEDTLWLHNNEVGAADAIYLRIAINIGEMRVERGDYFGEAVNIAARMEGVTPAGEIYIADAIYQTMNRQDIAIEAVGSFDFKGVPEPVRVHRVVPYASPQHVAVGFTSPDGQKASLTDGCEGGATAKLRHKVDPPFGGVFASTVRRSRWRRLAFLAAPFLVTAFTIGVVINYRVGVEARDRQLTQVEALLARGELEGASALIDTFRPETPSEALRRDTSRRALAWAWYRQGRFDAAQKSLDWLLAGDTREPQDILLQGHLTFAIAGEALDVTAGMRALDLYEEALTIDPRIGNDEDLSKNAIHCYHDPKLRTKADWLVSGYIKERATFAIAQALKTNNIDFALRHWFISRLEKLGAAELVDWVDVSIRDLDDGTCQYRRRAISKLLELADPRAVGPLLKVAGSNGCAGREAKAAANAIIAQSGGRR